MFRCRFRKVPLKNRSGFRVIIHKSCTYDNINRIRAISKRKYVRAYRKAMFSMRNEKLFFSRAESGRPNHLHTQWDFIKIAGNAFLFWKFDIGLASPSDSALLVNKTHKGRVESVRICTSTNLKIL